MRLTLITRNWSLKVFSLFVSLVIFLFVSVESATPVDVDFPVHYDLDDDMILSGDPPDVLHATLQGPWANFRSYERAELHPVEIALRKMEPGTVRVRVDTDGIRPPGGMSVVSVRPAELDLLLDRKVERQKPVEADIVDRPAFGFEILSVRIDPVQVRVSGPLTEVNKYDFVRTRAINLEGREQSVDGEVELREPGPGVRLLERKVKVLVEIGEEYVERSFAGLPVIVDNATSGTRAVPDSVGITLKGPRRVIDNLDRKALEIFVDARPEVDEGKRSFDKVVALRVTPARAMLVGQAPSVTVQVPKRARRR